MMRLLRNVLLFVLPAFAGGCQNLQPAVELPTFVSIGGSSIKEQNPAYFPLAPNQYGHVFETALQVLGDYGFEIAESNRYSGHIEASPRIAPGIALLLKPGSPDLYERWLAMFQTYRHRVTVIIQTSDPNPVEHGGYFVEFVVRKELEDSLRPLRSTVGGAVFRNENTVERQTEVIDPTGGGVFYDPHWIFRGRDPAMEQELIRRFKNAL